MDIYSGYMAKGFIKMLEVIIACIIMVSSLSYFFSVQVRTSEWPSAFLSNMGKDAMIVMDSSGTLRNLVTKNNFTESQMGLEYYIKKMLPQTVMFSVEMEDIPRPNITIGCNCTASELQRLKDILGISYGSSDVIKYRGREIYITIVTLDPPGTPQGIKEFIERTEYPMPDIIVFFTYTDMRPISSLVDNYFEKRKSMIFISDASQTNFDSYFNEIFGFSWRGGTPWSGSSFRDLSSRRNLSRVMSYYFSGTPARITTVDIGTGERQGDIRIQGTSHIISTYYNSTPGMHYVNDSGTLYREGEEFTKTGVYGTYTLNISKIDANATDGWTYTDIAITDMNYEFEIPNAANLNNVSVDDNSILANNAGLFSSMKANQHVSDSGNGRAVWIKSYDRAETDINQLFTSAILWAASEKFSLDENLNNPKTLPKSYEKVSYVVSGNTEFEPYVIHLLLWYLF